MWAEDWSSLPGPAWLPGGGVRVLSFLPSPDASALVAALTQFSYLAADTIVHGGATSHLAPTDPADRKWAPGLTPTRRPRWTQGRRGTDRAWRQTRCGGVFQAPDPPLSPGLIDTCRECGARALELAGRLQQRHTLQQAQPGLARTPLQGILRLGQVRGAAWGLPG